MVVIAHPARYDLTPTAEYALFSEFTRPTVARVWRW